VQIGIEGIGVFGTVYINQQQQQRNQKAGGGHGSYALSAADFEKMTTWGQGLDKSLSGMTLGTTPTSGGNGGSS